MTTYQGPSSLGVVDEPIIASSALKQGLGEEEILQHADELAARFENYKPDPSDELDPAPVAALRSAVRERSEAERHLIEAVRQARAAHLS